MKFKQRKRVTFYEGEDIYTKEGREHDVNSGHLKNWEDGFMDGYEAGFFE